MKFTVDIPIQPVAFARAGSNGKRRFTPPKQAKYRQDIQVYARQAWKGPPSKKAITMSIDIRVLWPKSRRHPSGYIEKTSRPDIDNYAKEILDSLNGFIYLDDAQVVCLTISKSYSPFQGVYIEAHELLS
jgi:Holliday junction resolvase RusA-like endonuclease